MLYTITIILGFTHYTVCYITRVVSFMHKKHNYCLYRSSIHVKFCKRADRPKTMDLRCLDFNIYIQWTKLSEHVY